MRATSMTGFQIVCSATSGSILLRMLTYMILILCRFVPRRKGFLESWPRESTEKDVPYATVAVERIGSLNPWILSQPIPLLR